MVKENTRNQSTASTCTCPHISKHMCTHQDKITYGIIPEKMLKNIASWFDLLIGILRNLIKSIYYPICLWPKVFQFPVRFHNIYIYFTDVLSSNKNPKCYKIWISWVPVQGSNCLGFWSPEIQVFTVAKGLLDLNYFHLSGSFIFDLLPTPWLPPFIFESS